MKHHFIVPHKHNQLSFQLNLPNAILILVCELLGVNIPTFVYSNFYEGLGLHF